MSKPEFNELDIKPGYNVVEVGNKLEELFDSLAEAYPDKKIVWSSWDHDKWDRTAKFLCKAFGYSRGKELFNAFGYEVAEENEQKNGEPEKEKTAVSTDAVTEDASPDTDAVSEPAEDVSAGDATAVPAVPEDTEGENAAADPAVTEALESDDAGSSEKVPSEEEVSEEKAGEETESEDDPDISGSDSQRIPYKKKFKVRISHVLFILLYIATVAAVIWIAKFG